VREESRRYLAEHGDPARATARAAALPAGDDTRDPDLVLNEAILAAARDVDPAASSLAWLDARLRGEAVDDGGLDTALAASLLPALEEEVRAARARGTAETGLKLVGLSRGSAIVHLRPTLVAQEPDEGQIPAVLSPADGAIRHVLQLHDDLEREVEPAALASGHSQPMLSAASKFVGVLQRHGLTLELRWRPPTGEPRISRLTERGVAHAASVFAPAPQNDAVTIVGLVQEMSLSGRFAIKPGPTAARIVHIDPEDLRALDLRLGERIAVEVRRTEEIDLVGIRRPERLEFVRRLPAAVAETLDLGEVDEPQD